MFLAFQFSTGIIGKKKTEKWGKNKPKLKKKKIFIIKQGLSFLLTMKTQSIFQFF